MREIKFRARYKHPESDSEGFIYFDISEGLFVADGNMEIILIDQYTGLLDKNGKYIYEGDILNVCCNPYFELYIVKYGEYKLKDQTSQDCQKYHLSFYLENINGFYVLSLLDVIKGDELQPFYGRSKSYGEVIGNIYENPELLEAE